MSGMSIVASWNSPGDGRGLGMGDSNQIITWDIVDTMAMMATFQFHFQSEKSKKCDYGQVLDGLCYLQFFDITTVVTLHVVI
jgi:hypothetical protein